MEDCFCYAWTIPLAAAIPCLLAWLTSFVRGRGERERGEHRVTPPQIHGLTPEFRAALDRCTDGQHGRCSEPQNLRHMSREALAAKLMAAEFEHKQLPLPDDYETWPYQAGLLDDGEYETLYEWQRARWPNTLPPPTPHRRWHRGRESVGRIAWFLASLFLLASSALLFRFAPCSAVTKCIRLELTTDMFFPYNKFAPYSDAHRKVLRQHLNDFFAQYRGVTITKIEAHTDPIGAADENDKLGIARAETILSLMRELQAADVGHEQFSDAALPSAPTQTGPSRDLDDIAIWRWCFGNLYQSVDKSELRPLIDLESDSNAATVPCSRAPNPPDGTYPACANPFGRGAPEKVFLEQAERFREITECLAPMRHVVIYGTYVSLADVAPHR